MTSWAVWIALPTTSAKRRRRTIVRLKSVGWYSESDGEFTIKKESFGSADTAADSADETINANRGLC